MKIKNKHSLIIVLLLIFLALVSLSFPHDSGAEEPYDVALKKALELDKDGFYEDAIEYWKKSLKGSPSKIRLYSNL